jgi:hypothetical protein
VAFTFGNVTYPIAGAALAHLGLAWPTGRLRSRFERWVVITEYASNIGFNLLGTMFWNPVFSGCNASCPANLLLVHSSRSVWDAINLTTTPFSLVLTVIVVTLIIRHWKSARGWCRQALVPLVWISLAIGVESLVTTITGNLNIPFSPGPCPASSSTASPRWCTISARRCS